MVFYLSYAQFFKFHPSVSKLIMNCICTSNIAILVNNSITKFFKSSRGIDICQWDQIHLSSPVHVIFHFFFTDDLTLMTKVSEKSCKSIKKCPTLFYNLSGPNINLKKLGVIFSKNCAPNVAKEMANFLTCTLAIPLENI